ncbi:MAG: phosphatidylserine decarboxylase [Sulfurimonas sp.]|uniref:phosphatidylserine decarboxylase n=1 Tax=Sulfurimonas sp. TaxID=2022749 RepID=UPI0025E0C2B1|nr:phosphatidylserine decarboxylase [Sulfurimonas sp.]MCK9491415.1 phosphatidylserine decarboxylase [Sulfurimonas sp.]
MNNNLLPIAKEGFNRIGFTFLAFVFFTIFDFDFFEFLSFVMVLFLLLVYRNPERMSPILEVKSVVSPVDGTVIAIEELDDSEYAYKVEINSSYFDVSLLRIPLSAIVKSLDIKRGARLSKDSPLSKDLNERVEIVFEDSFKNTIKVKHMLKQSFDTIKVDLNTKQNTLQGARYGLMINGITTIYLPHNFRVNLSIGQEVDASQSLVGYFS